MPRQPLEFYENEGITPESTLNESARTLLRDYAHIPDDSINHHVNQIRKEAFKVAPYPCIGMFQFLDLSLKSMISIYPEIIDRVKNGDKFLDLGCCLGQEIRRLVLDGAPSVNTYGSDLYEEFFAVGYKLFNDYKESGAADGGRRLDTTFIAADVFDDTSRLVTELAGKMDILYTGAFFHLFTLNEQEKVAARVVQLLAPNPGSLIVGRQSGSEEAGEDVRKGGPGGRGPFRHNAQSWKDLWERVGQATGSRWSVEADVSSPEYSLAGVADGKSKEMQSKITGRGLRYVIRRL
ncbi:hypothetical protein V8F20_005326 [Naviculisporaceae sp. PSN 640]